MNHRKTVLVTGSSRGIGRAIALSFAKKGYNIVITCLKNKEKLEEVRDEILQMGVDCLALVTDVGDYHQVLELFQAIELHFGGIDVLVNNAGISYVGLLTDMSVDEWSRLMNTNLNALFYCSKCALPHMLQNKEGRIINISSVWGDVGASCEVAYSASKGGVNSFTRALAKELAPSNIQVNAISCGAIDTEMNAFLCEEDRLALTEEIPASRFGTPEEIGEIALSLATGPSYLTGQIIRVDGAWI